jgi:hypothetical protein
LLSFFVQIWRRLSLLQASAHGRDVRAFGHYNDATSQRVHIFLM